ncbi:MAG TPA: hypothetical protein VLV86_13815 [Vicinamibacterales bacterium]|nr:hypothetical protein [Vicinamibacterales bacterium]
MEIHAPEKPILTVKEAAVHLLIVTVGILIALSLEGIVEYVHHRTIVREAREIMHAEIQENHDDLERTMKQLALQTDDLGNNIEVFSAISRGEKPEHTGMRYGLAYRSAQLHNAAKTTAELMGAFELMDYRDVRRYAAIYDSQDRFMREQTAALVVGTSAFAWKTRRPKPYDASPAETAVFADKLRETLGALTVTRQFGAALQRDYEQFLAGK